ncbi:NAD-dependent epimerase/dehydratase family protein [Rhizobium sp. 007]|uniref:NAD-dependent epimerase/dehydratase family protein n=1 Tax=Rhizobium sp. 007 TaxID=2785056 RepID=UPI0018906D88|nr:NAD-dependent epimerase/dehydratase family protein [Rhizobium sp. 007]QPB23709.1 NAD-dependent epimerase/dehydratase family protein [Rhizobium sp. 007]
MQKNALVIGGTRFFGRLLVRRLLEAGLNVTVATRGITSDDFGSTVSRVTVDRRDEDAMDRAFAGRGDYDVIFDQMCYSPLDARISESVFAGRVGRYIMASTIEVYAQLLWAKKAPFDEDLIDLSNERTNPDFPWRDETYSESLYGEAKRAAEVWFHQSGILPVVSVRIGHILSGPDDFTGRLRSYVDRVSSGRPLFYSINKGKSSFFNPAGIADFLYWAGQQTFTGAINACANGTLTALEIHQAVASVMGREAQSESMTGISRAAVLSPYDFPADYAMSSARAISLGYKAPDVSQWLPGVIAAQLEHGR